MLPELDPTTQAAFRAAYGTVLLGAVLWNLLQGRRFFLSERWGGYGQESLPVNAIQNPACFPLVMATWVLCAVGIMCGWWGIWPALVNVLLCRYFFIAMRWNGVLRGMGAPGYMTYWVGVAVLLLEYTAHHAPELQSLALLTLQVDWALIMLTAGIYKFTAGYPHNHGMELGMANPQWGTWWQVYVGMKPSHPMFWIFNQLAWITEIGASILMLIPDTRWIGGVIIGASFLGVGSQVRLNHLTLLLALTSLIFLDPSCPPVQWLTQSLGSAAGAEVTVGPLATVVNKVLHIVLVGYLIMLPFAYAGLYYNFYWRRKLASSLQWILERYTNFFGMILWRVFSVNLIDFFIRIHVQPRDGKSKRRLVSRYGWGGPPRFNHVGESIAITTVFTTLKYYPDNVELFHDRLLRYARTIPCPADCILVFEYVSIIKTPERFDFISMAEYHVDLATGTVTEKILRQDAPMRSANPYSRVHTAARPGSYAPVAEEQQEADDAG